MKSLYPIAAGVLLTSSLHAQPAAAGLEARLKQACESVPLKKDAKRSVLAVETSLNSKPVWMVVDTGADALLFSTAAAELAGIPLKTSIYAPDGGKGVEVQVGAVTDFKIGQSAISSEATPFASFSRMGELELEGGNQPPGGQLGTAVLASMKLAVDFGGRRLLVPAKEVPAGGIAAVYSEAGVSAEPVVVQNYRVLVPAVVAGKNVLLLCMSGAGRSMLSESALQELGLSAPDDGTRREVKVPTAKIGSTEVKDRVFGLNPMPVTKVGDRKVVGILGLDLLEESRAVLAMGENRILFPK